MGRETGQFRQGEAENGADSGQRELNGHDGERGSSKPVRGPSAEEAPEPEPEHEGRENRGNGVVGAAESQGELSPPLELEDQSRDPGGKGRRGEQDWREVVGTGRHRGSIAAGIPDVSPALTRASDLVLRSAPPRVGVHPSKRAPRHPLLLLIGIVLSIRIDRSCWTVIMLWSVGPVSTWPEGFACDSESDSDCW